VDGRIAGVFCGLPLVELHRHSLGNWSGLIHSELCPHGTNVAVLMDGDRVMLLIEFGVLGVIEGDTPEIMHPEPFLHWILDLHNQALVSNDTEIFDLQNDGGNYHALIIINEHSQSSVNA